MDIAQPSLLTIGIDNMVRDGDVFTMPAKKSRPERPRRKKRTRSHVIADWSVFHIEWFVLREGWSAERVFRDYGFDVTVTTFDRHGYAEAGEIKMQLKATDNIERYRLKGSDTYSFAITRADFNLWNETLYPVFFILYDAEKDIARWQYVQAWFAQNPPPQGTAHLQLHIPRQNVIDLDTMTMMRKAKQSILRQARGVKHE